MAKLFKSTVARHNVSFVNLWVHQAFTFTFTLTFTLFFQSCGGFQEKRRSIQTQNSWKIQPDKSPDWGGSEADVGCSGNRRI